MFKLNQKDGKTQPQRLLLEEKAVQAGGSTCTKASRTELVVGRTERSSYSVVALGPGQWDGTRAR